MGGIWGRAVTGSSRACRDSGSNRSSSAIHHAQLLALLSSATLVISAMAGGVVEASLPAQPTAAPGLPYEAVVTPAGTAL